MDNKTHAIILVVCFAIGFFGGKILFKQKHPPLPSIEQVEKADKTRKTA